MGDLFIFATRYIKFYSPLLLPPKIANSPQTPPLLVVTRAGSSRAYALISNPMVKQ